MKAAPPQCDALKPHPSLDCPGLNTRSLAVVRERRAVPTRQPATAAVAFMLALTACTRNEMSGDAVTATTATAAPPPISGADYRYLEDLSGDGDPSQSPIDAYWSRVLDGVGVRYMSPAAVIAHDPGQAPDTACAGRVPTEEWTGNAAYCDQDQVITYDRQFVAGLVERVGEHAGLGVLAHEWGHHVQHVLGGGGYSLQRELEADCLAALYIGDLELADGPLAMEDSFEAFFRLGDTEYAAATWFDAAEHGSPNQRLAAATLGFYAIQGGLPFCRGFSKWTPNARVSLGPLTLVEIPGHLGEVTAAGVYSVPSGALPGFTAQRVQMAWDPSEPGASVSSWLAGQSVVSVDVASEVPTLVIVQRPGANGQSEWEVVGFYTHESDPGYVIIVRSPLSDGLATDEDVEAASIPSGQVVLVAGTRLCWPGEQAGDAAEPGFNNMCDPDL